MSLLQLQTVQHLQAQKCSSFTIRTTIPIQRLDSLPYAPRHEGMCKLDEVARFTLRQIYHL
jgi:hypothetical protein